MGVKTPNRMPPRMIMGVSKGKKAALVAAPFSCQLAFSRATGKLCFFASRAVTAIRPKPINSPGMTPAAKSAATDTSMV